MLFPAEFATIQRRLPSLLVALAVCFLVPMIQAEEPKAEVIADNLFVANRLEPIVPLVEEAIRNSKMPGCVICAGRSSGIGYLRAFGNRQVEPEKNPMQVDTVFDLASLTKPVATATSIMALKEDDQVQLTTRVAEIFPDFGSQMKDTITIEQLLVHQSGLIADNAMSDYKNGPEEAWQKICSLPLHKPVNSEFVYSDVNFIVLGKVVEKLSGKSLKDYSHERIFAPLKMDETGFVPNESLRARSAPTEKRDGQWIQGVVHDPRAYALDGVAGHAGLFSTASDLSLYARAMMRTSFAEQPAVEGRQTILSERIIHEMTLDRTVSKGLRGLGWDKRTGYSTNRGSRMSPAAFGHGGFTGTVLWIDPELDLFFIFLSNRVHPDGKGSVNLLAGSIADIIVSALPDR